MKMTAKELVAERLAVKAWFDKNAPEGPDYEKRVRAAYLASGIIKKRRCLKLGYNGRVQNPHLVR
jgi:hypothetical protein